MPLVITDPVCPQGLHARIPRAHRTWCFMKPLKLSLDRKVSTTQEDRVTGSPGFPDQVSHHVIVGKVIGDCRKPPAASMSPSKQR